MKKIIKLTAVLLSVAVIATLTKITVSANSDKVEEAEMKNTTVDKEQNIANEESNGEENTVNTQEKRNEDGTVTYRLVVHKMDYYSFCKGNSGEHTLEYRVNGGPVHKVKMRTVAFEPVVNTQPLTWGHAYDIEGVKDGDIIDYTYTYYNFYFQFKENTQVTEQKVVAKPYMPEDEVL